MLSKEMLSWMWLFIDEINMVSARMLADIDMRLRAAAHAIGTMKYDKNHRERPFGGLNVVFAGDFYQLGPPEENAWSLSRTPASFFHDDPPKKAAPFSEYGLCSGAMMAMSG